MDNRASPVALIPKIIWTIWISKKPLPDELSRWVETHNQPGYDHRTVYLDSCKTLPSRYLREAIEAERWIKVTDYLRMYLLYHEGGIYLDCDMQIIKPLDDLLHDTLFVCRENERVIANSVIGAEPYHTLIGLYLNMVEDNFRGSGSMIFEPAERLFTDLIMGVYGNMGTAHIYPSDYFFPLDEVSGELHVTPNTHVIHHFRRSWK